MNEIKSIPGAQRENIDTIFWENLAKLEGKKGIGILPNDKPDIISRLIKALKDRDGLPDDLNNPETMTEVEAVNEFAEKLYDLFCEGAVFAESMMVSAQVKKTYEDIMEETGNTRDWEKETGCSASHSD